MKNHFKAIIISLMALTLICTLAACGKKNNKVNTQSESPIEQMTKPGQFVYMAITKDDLDTDANLSDAISTIIKFGKNHTFQEQNVAGFASKISFQTPSFQTGDGASEIDSGTWSIQEGNELVLKSQQTGTEKRKLTKKVSGKLPADDTNYIGLNDPSFKTNGALVWKK